MQAQAWNGWQGVCTYLLTLGFFPCAVGPKPGQAPQLMVVGWYFLLAFVGATIPAGIYGGWAGGCGRAAVPVALQILLTASWEMGDICSTHTASPATTARSGKAAKI